MNPTLLSKLRHLRLSGMAEALPGRLTQATGASLPHLEFLELLVEDELNRRADRLFTRRLRQAEIVQIKEIKDFDWAFNPKIPRAKLAELAAARFVALHEDVLLIGPPGVGKSHIATAIAVGAIRAGYRVLVRSAFDLAQDFLEAEALQQRKQLVSRLTKIDLLVIEDFGMKRLGPNAAEDLLEVDPILRTRKGWVLGVACSVTHPDSTPVVAVVERPSVWAVGAVGNAKRFPSSCGRAIRSARPQLRQLPQPRSRRGTSLGLPVLLRSHAAARAMRSS